MKKGLFSALCLLALLTVPACCWRKDACAPVCEPCEKPCPRPCVRTCPKEKCVDTVCKEVEEAVPATRKVKYITRVTKSCGPVIAAPCCDEDENLIEEGCNLAEGRMPVKAERRSSRSSR